MRESEIFPSKNLSAGDLLVNGKPQIWQVTIGGLSLDEFKKDGSTTKKRVLHFQEIDKSMVLNTTNWRAIAKITGQDDDLNWIGKKIELFYTMVEFQGDMVPAIRVRPVGGWEAASAQAEVVVPGKAPARAPAVPVAGPAVVADDDLPF